MIIQFIADTMVGMEAFDDAVRQYRDIVTMGDIGNPTPNFPANPAFVHPGAQPTGIFESLNDLVDRIESAPSYTEEDGVLLQIIPSKPDPISPDLVKPDIEAKADQTGYKFNVEVSKREKADMWDVLIMRKGETSFSSVKTATGKSVDVTIMPTPPGDAEQIQVRVQLKKKNENYGEPSDIVYVTVNP